MKHSLHLNSSIIALALVLGISLGAIYDVHLPITGFASTGTGTVNVTVPQITSLTLLDASINFTTLSGGETNNSEWFNDFFNISNNGNVGINVTVYSRGSPFSASGCSSLPNACWQIKCNITGGGGGGWCAGSTNSTWTQLGAEASNSTMITNLARDGTAKVGINITIKNQEPAGAKNGTVVFTAVKNDTYE